MECGEKPDSLEGRTPVSPGDGINRNNDGFAPHARARTRLHDSCFNHARIASQSRLDRANHRDRQRDHGEPGYCVYKSISRNKIRQISFADPNIPSATVASALEDASSWLRDSSKTRSICPANEPEMYEDYKTGGYGREG